MDQLAVSALAAGRVVAADQNCPLNGQLRLGCASIRKAEVKAEDARAEIAHDHAPGCLAQAGTAQDPV